MIKSIKIVILFLALIFLIPTISTYTLPRIVNIETLKTFIIKAVETHTERKLTIHGNIKLSLYPKTELEISDLELSNIEDFDKKPFISIKTVTLQVKLLPLLQDQLSIQHTTLDQLTLNLRKNSENENNWSSIVKALQSSDLTHISMGKLQVNQATIYWQNDLTNTFYTLDNLFISTNKLSINHSLKVKSNFNLINPQNQSNKNITLTSYIKPDSNLKYYDFNQSNITIETKSRNQPEKQQPIIFSAESSTLNLSDQTLLIPSWNIQLFGAEIQGNTSGFALLDTPKFTGSIKTSNFNPRAVLEKIDDKIYTTRDPSALTKASIRSQYTATPDSFAANNFYMRFDKSILDGFIEINDFSNPVIDFSLNLNKLEINHYLPEKFSPVPIAEWPLKSLRKLDIRGILNIEHLNISNFTSGNSQIAILAENGLIQITRLESIIYGGELGGEMTLNIKTDRPTLSGHLKLTGLNPRIAIDELRKTPVETPYIDALHRLDASFQINATQESTKLSKIEIKLDKSSADGILNIEHSTPPKIATKLNIDNFNLDHYLPPEQTAYDALFTTQIMQNILNSTLNIKQLTAFGQKCKAVTMKKNNTDTEPYLFTITTQKSEKREIKGNHFTKTLQTLMKSQCFKS